MKMMKFFGSLISAILIVHNTSSAQSHFNTIWTGNPYQSMNIYVTSASYQGVHLTANDEIAVFDGDICVGVKVLTSPIGSTPLSIIAGEDDPITTETDGFTSTDDISL